LHNPSYAPKVEIREAIKDEYNYFVAIEASNDWSIFVFQACASRTMGIKIDNF